MTHAKLVAGTDPPRYECPFHVVPLSFSGPRAFAEAALHEIRVHTVGDARQDLLTGYEAGPVAQEFFHEFSHTFRDYWETTWTGKLRPSAVGIAAAQAAFADYLRARRGGR